VLCVDEKSQIQALDRTAPILPMRPGIPERQTHDYKRSGTSSLDAALDLTTSKVMSALRQRQRVVRVEVARMLLTAAAIGGLIKRNASLSGAEVGCEVGVGGGDGGGRTGRGARREPCAGAQCR
jgi:hypothetical protein